MRKVFGIAVRKGGQGKSTTVSTVGRLCALYGARVLVVDLAQPGTTTSSLRDIWPESEHGELSRVMVSFQMEPSGTVPDVMVAREALAAAMLPVVLRSQPSWNGGRVLVLPWDELQGDAAAFLHSERVLEGLLGALEQEFDLALIDYPGESGPLLTNALMATTDVVIPVVTETPALEGVESMLRLMARVREAGHALDLAGVLLTRCDPRNRRAFEIVQTILQAGEVEGESLGRKLLPFAIRQNEFFEQAFRYGEPIWERSSNPAHWAGYVLFTEWLLRKAGLMHLATARRGPALLGPDVRILSTSGLLVDDPDVPLSNFETAHSTLGG